MISNRAVERKGIRILCWSFRSVFRDGRQTTGVVVVSSNWSLPMYRSRNESLSFCPSGAIEWRRLRLIVDVPFEGGSQERKDSVGRRCSSSVSRSNLPECG